jgi:hypothetical protein
MPIAAVHLIWKWHLTDVDSLRMSALRQKRSFNAFLSGATILKPVRKRHLSWCHHLPDGEQQTEKAYSLTRMTALRAAATAWAGVALPAPHDSGGVGVPSSKSLEVCTTAAKEAFKR